MNLATRATLVAACLSLSPLTVFAGGAPVRALDITVPLPFYEPHPTETATLDPVTVTGTRTPQPLADALSQTYVITRKQIERSSATSVVSVIRRYTGIQIGQSGGPGQSVSVSMRGANANQTIVLIDGIRVGSIGNAISPLQDITPAMVQRIEVVEGPRSVLYGADAIGGVINIITRKPGPGQVQLSAGGGSYGTESGSMSLRDEGQLAGHHWGVALNAQQVHSDGFPAIQGGLFDSQYRNRTLNGRFDFDLGRTKLEARVWDSHGYNGFYNSATDPVFDDFHNQILALEESTRITDWLTSSLTLSNTRTVFDQPGQPLTDSRPEVDLHNVAVVGKHNRVSFGARFQNERLSEGVTGAAAPLHANVAEDYGYLQDEANYGRNHLVVAGSYLKNSQFGGRADWNFSYGYDLFTNTRLIFDAGSAFRAPTLVDLYYPPLFGFATSNPDLKPEEALDYEVAVRQQITPDQSLEFRLFRTDISNLIQLDTSFVPQNIARARLQGAQISWQYAGGAWTSHVNATYTDPIDLTTEQPLLRRSRWSASASIDHQFGRFDLGGGVYSQSEQPDNITNPYTFASFPGFDGGYALVDLHAGVKITKRLSLQLHVDNALDHHYVTVSPYNQPGATVYGSMTYTFPLA